MTFETDYRVDVTHSGNTTRVTGWVDTTDVISVSNQIYGEWHIGTSICLPSDIKRAQTIIDCMVAVMQKVDEIRWMNKL